MLVQASVFVGPHPDFEGAVERFLVASVAIFGSHGEDSHATHSQLHKLVTIGFR